MNGPKLITPKLLDLNEKQLEEYVESRIINAYSLGSDNAMKATIISFETFMKESDSEGLTFEEILSFLKSLKEVYKDAN